MYFLFVRHCKLKMKEKSNTNINVENERERVLFLNNNNKKERKREMIDLSFLSTGIISQNFKIMSIINSNSSFQGLISLSSQMSTLTYQCIILNTLIDLNRRMIISTISSRCWAYYYQIKEKIRICNREIERILSSK